MKQTNIEKLIEWMEEMKMLSQTMMDDKNYCSVARQTFESCILKAKQLQQEELSQWISVEDRLPTKEDADENGKILVWREVESTQALMSKSIYDYTMAKYLDKSSFWQPLPNPPINKQPKAINK